MEGLKELDSRWGTSYRWNFERRLVDNGSSVVEGEAKRK
jgi:hypothetical protein